MAHAHSVTLSSSLIARVEALPLESQYIMAAFVRQMRIDGPHLIAGYAIGQFDRFSVDHVEHGQAIGFDWATAYLDVDGAILKLRLTGSNEAGVQIEEG